MQSIEERVRIKNYIGVKSLIMALLLNVSASSPARAEFAQTLVIADTALDSSMAEFSNNVVHELCILDWPTCPNGENFMEGKGSANLPTGFLSSNGFNHGTQMVSASVRTNPKVKIIFIRMIANSNYGMRLRTSDYTIAKVLDWVNRNKDKYNIQAVAISQGHHNLSLLTDYCPKNSAVDTLIEQLMVKNVPLFSPTGNGGDRSRIDWPACIPKVISVGALNLDRSVSTYSNNDQKLVDYFELGTLKVLDANDSERTSTGSSLSAQIAAAKWMMLREAYPDYDFMRSKEVLDSQVEIHSFESGGEVKKIKKYFSIFVSSFDIQEALSQIRKMLVELQLIILNLKQKELD
jgi:hypothetical protein